MKIDYGYHLEKENRKRGHTHAVRKEVVGGLNGRQIATITEDSDGIFMNAGLLLVVNDQEDYANRPEKGPHSVV